MKDSIGISLMRWRNRIVLPFLHGDVLDMGCGTNTLIQEYRSLHPDSCAIGADVFAWNGVDLRIDDAGQLPFEDHCFDTIACVAAFNHIPNRRLFLNEAKRILRPDGKLILTMIHPFISYIWHHIRSPWDADQHERGMAEGEVYGFSFSEMSNELNTAQFSVVYFERFMLNVNCLYVAQI